VNAGQDIDRERRQHKGPYQTGPGPAGSVVLRLHMVYCPKPDKMISEHVSATKHGIQAVTSNRNTSDLFACISKSVGRVK